MAVNWVTETSRHIIQSMGAGRGGTENCDVTSHLKLCELITKSLVKRDGPQRITWHDQSDGDLPWCCRAACL